MRTFTVLMLVVTAVAAQAADSTLDAGRRCAQVKDSLERLVCFDRVFAADAASRSAPAAPPAPPPVAATPPSAPRQAAPVPAPAPAVVPTPSPAPRGFGEEQIKRTEKERQLEEPPRSVTARVASLVEYRKGLVRMTLDNGQVWEQMDMDGLFRVASGDTVQIERGRMGGYRMARTSDGRTSGWTRVTRVK